MSNICPRSVLFHRSRQDLPISDSHSLENPSAKHEGRPFHLDRHNRMADQRGQQHEVYIVIFQLINDIINRQYDRRSRPVYKLIVQQVPQDTPEQNDCFRGIQCRARVWADAPRSSTICRWIVTESVAVVCKYGSCSSCVSARSTKVKQNE